MQDIVLFAEEILNGERHILCSVYSSLLIKMVSWFCGMVDRRKTFRLIFSRDHSQRSSPSRISHTSGAGYECEQNLSPDFVEWSCTVVITTTPRRFSYVIRNHSTIFFRGLFMHTWKRTTVKQYGWLWVHGANDYRDIWQQKLDSWNQNKATGLFERSVKCPRYLRIEIFLS